MQSLSKSRKSLLATLHFPLEVLYILWMTSVPILYPFVLFFEAVWWFIVTAVVFLLNSLLSVLGPLIWGLLEWQWYLLCLPFTLIQWMVLPGFRLVLTGMVWFLNVTPGGYHVLKALNGHVMKHLQE